jgi:NIMA (never in mitosis gene a)-related kinase
MPRATYSTPRGQMLTYAHKLGSGSFGVASAVKNRKGELLCLKEIQVHTADESAKAEALNEVERLKTCQHPNIVTYFDSWFDRHRLYILMEYAPNGSLDHLIAQYAKEGKRFTMHKVTHFLHEMVSALHYCHDVLLVMHRDIKPANVLIDQLGTLKLADFGLSKPLDAGRMMCKTMVGTPLYMAPEQCAGECYSFPADVWSLGCVLYELMALRSPWEVAGPCPAYPVHVRRVVRGTIDFSPLASYPARLVETAKWMLHRDAHRRATTHQVLDLLEMRAPPTLYATPAPYAVPPVPFPPAAPRPRSPRDEQHLTLERRHQIVEEAKQMAAIAIQRSFRKASVGNERPVAPAARPPPRVAPRFPAVPSALPPPPKGEEDASVKVIQRAMRTSLNRRRRLPVLAKNVAPPAPPASKPRAVPIRVPRRIDTLATPRVPKPRVGGVPAVRPAWV